jgi:hypothetical protein
MLRCLIRLWTAVGQLANWKAPCHRAKHGLAAVIIRMVRRVRARPTGRRPGINLAVAGKSMNDGGFIFDTRLFVRPCGLGGNRSVRDATRLSLSWCE